MGVVALGYGHLLAVLCRVKVLRGRAGVQDGPLVRLLREGLGVLEHHLGDLGVLRVFGVRELEEHAEGEEGRLDRLDGGPAGAEGVEADCTLVGDVVS